MGIEQISNDKSACDERFVVGHNADYHYQSAERASGFWIRMLRDPTGVDTFSMT